MKKVLVVLLLAFISSTCFSQETTQGTAAVEIYQKNRQVFQDKKNQTDQQFQQEISAIESEMKALEGDIQKTDEKLAQFKSLIVKKQIGLTTLNTVKRVLSGFFFPLASAASNALFWFSNSTTGPDKLFSAFFLLTILNLFLYFMFKQKQLFKKYRIALIVSVVVLLSAIAAPLLAEENLTKREKVVKKLESAEKVLSLTDYERFIAILESWDSGDPIELDLSRLDSKDSLLTVFPKVILDTPEYYFTLAALYMHEGKTGKAVDAMEKIIDADYFQTKQTQNLIAISSIKFFIQQKQTEFATKAVENLAKRIDNVSILLQLAEFLQNNNMSTSNEKVLGYAIERAETVQELVELSVFLFDKEKNDKGSDALEQALNRVSDVEQLILVTSAAIKAKKESIVELAIKKTELLREFKHRIQIVDLFLERGRNEEAISVFSEMIKAVKGNTHGKIEKLLFLIDTALQRELITQAIKATEKLFMYLGNDKFNYIIKAAGQLKSAETLPNQDKITLPQFYGMLNEELKYVDKAESQYIESITNSLNHILQSYGYGVPDSLNDFHLLGRVWIAENRGAVIGQLDRLYTIIEAQFINQLETINDNRIKDLRVKVNEKRDRLEQLRTEVLETKPQVNKLSRKLIAQLISIIATIAFGIAIFIGCAIISYEYTKGLTFHKTFGFISKFIEMTGWVRVFSILAVISGLMSILFAQTLQIFQCINENSHSHRNPELKEKIELQE